MSPGGDDGDIDLTPDQQILFRALDVVAELEREAVPFGEQWRDVCMSLRRLIACLWEKIDDASTVEGQRNLARGHDSRPPGTV